MTRALEPLDSAKHRLLQVGPSDAGMPPFIQIVATEFASAAACCAILFTKSAQTGQFYAGALYGFRAGEDLFEGAEVPPYRPLDIERQGFFITGENIAIDPHHPRFKANAGEPLFDAEGLPTPQLRAVQRILGQLKTGIEETDAFIQALLKHRLIEPMDVSLRFDDGETLTLGGLYTVSLDSLRELDDEAALDLFRRGYLQLAYYMIGSLKQIGSLARRRNRRLATGQG